MISGQPYLFVFSWSNLVFSYPFGLLCLDIYLRFCCFRTRLSCSMGSFQNIKSTTTKMTKHSHCFIFSCVFLLPAVSWWEARARLATDWVPSCSPCHVFWMCTWRQLTRRARGVLGWAPSLPNPFQDDFPISCPADCTLGRDLKSGVSLMFSSVHAKASPGDDRHSQACANGFLSQCVCQAVVFLCCLFDVYLAWCLVCLTQCLACNKSSLPLAWCGNLHGKYFWNSPLPIPSVFPFSRSISFPLPSTIQTFARCEEFSIH